MEEVMNIETETIELSNGVFIKAEVRSPLRRSVAHSTFNFETVSKQLKEISKIITESFNDAKPDKLSVELSIEFCIESGQLTAILIKGSSTANIKINLEWNKYDTK